MPQACAAGRRWSRCERLVHRIQAVADVPKLDVQAEHALVAGLGLHELAQRLVHVTEEVEHTDELLVARAGLVQRPLENHRRDRQLLLLDERLAQRLVRAKTILRPTQRLLKLGDGFVEKTHLLVADAEVVMRLVVFGVHIFGDALLELLEHVGKVGLLVAGRRILADHHARRFWRLLVAQPVAQRDVLVVAARGRRFCRRLCHRPWGRSCRRLGGWLGCWLGGWLGGWVWGRRVRGGSGPGQNWKAQLWNSDTAKTRM